MDSSHILRIISAGRFFRIPICHVVSCAGLNAANAGRGQECSRLGGLNRSRLQGTVALQYKDNSISRRIRFSNRATSFNSIPHAYFRKKPFSRATSSVLTPTAPKKCGRWQLRVLEQGHTTVMYVAYAISALTIR